LKFVIISKLWGWFVLVDDVALWILKIPIGYEQIYQKSFWVKGYPIKLLCVFFQGWMENTTYHKIVKHVIWLL
jgi:hypothetical protein